MARITEDLHIERAYRVPLGETDHTSLAGELVATVQQLNAVFGAPLYMDASMELGGGKTSVEWHVGTPRGPFTVYDYKEYDQPAALHPDREYEFHLGDREVYVADEGWVHVVAAHAFHMLGLYATSEAHRDRFEPEVREALAAIYRANFRTEG